VNVCTALVVLPHGPCATTCQKYWVDENHTGIAADVPAVPCTSSLCGGFTVSRNTSYVVAPVALHVTLAPVYPVVPSAGTIAVTAGAEVTTTEVVPAAEVQVPTAIVTEYVPPLIAAAAGIVGFCRLEVKPFGPVQE
jgi:hypothetical protein